MTNEIYLFNCCSNIQNPFFAIQHQSWPQHSEYNYLNYKTLIYYVSTSLCFNMTSIKSDVRLLYWYQNFNRTSNDFCLMFQLKNVLSQDCHLGWWTRSWWTIMKRTRLISDWSTKDWFPIGHLLKKFCLGAHLCLWAGNRSGLQGSTHK